VAADGAALHQLAADCAAYPDTVRRVMLPAVGSLLVDTAAAQAVTLSRYNRGAGVTLTATSSQVGRDTVRLTPRPLGAWAIVESGSNRSSWIIGSPPRKGKGGPKRVRLADGGVRWYVRHGPVRGRQAWSKTIDALEADLPTVVHDAAMTAWDQVR
jgi:hypothetical protein